MICGGNAASASSRCAASRKYVWHLLPLQYIEVFFRVGNQFTQSAFNAFLA